MRPVVHPRFVSSHVLPVSVPVADVLGNRFLDHRDVLLNYLFINCSRDVSLNL